MLPFDCIVLEKIQAPFLEVYIFTQLKGKLRNRSGRIFPCVLAYGQYAEAEL